MPNRNTSMKRTYNQNLGDLSRKIYDSKDFLLAARYTVQTHVRIR
jgi:hypothetical protein